VTTRELRPVQWNGETCLLIDQTVLPHAYRTVEIRTAEEVVRGERGVYSPQTGLARLVGGVRITRGQNQLNGQEAIVNLRTGVSRLVSAPGQRVQGIVTPQGGQGLPGPGGAAGGASGGAAGAAQPGGGR